MNAGQAADPERVDAAIREILARDEFRPEGESALMRLLEEIFGGAGTEALATIAEVVLYLIVGVLAVMLVYLLARAAGQARRARRTVAVAGGADAARADRVAAALAEARAAEGTGDLVRAMRFYFFALVLGLGERGDLEYRDAWTARELVERGEARKGVKRKLAPLIGRLDEVSFGHRPAAASDVATMRGLCERWLVV